MNWGAVASATPCLGERFALWFKAILIPTQSGSPARRSLRPLFKFSKARYHCGLD